MYTVYVLHSKLHDKIYIGQTSDLSKRLIAHNELSQNSWTSRYRPWIVIHEEEFITRSEAMKRERALKSAAGRRYIREQLLPNI